VHRSVLCPFVFTRRWHGWIFSCFWADNFNFLFTSWFLLFLFVHTLFVFDLLPGLTTSVCNLRPTSRGSVTPSGPTTHEPPQIHPNYLDTEHDKKVMVSEWCQNGARMFIISLFVFVHSCCNIILSRI
jgi:hypothetical protein